MGTPVEYDLEAGHQLCSLLMQLHDKITALVQLRTQQTTSSLDSIPGNWTGMARLRFDTEYRIQQQSLKTLGDRVLSIKARVDQANQAAIAARSGAHPTVS